MCLVPHVLQFLFNHISMLRFAKCLPQLLVERGASLESKDEEGAIPLHDACAGGRSHVRSYISTCLHKLQPERVQQDGYSSF